jgi:lipopolysaccharide/colanic/teichoic acid biosynthesis glycosyltransferase
MGLEGKEFRLIKFRTMREDKRSEEALFDMRSNSRITPLGKILRKYKLDEIPQLLNVVIGDMSVVGPRPEVKSWTKVYPEKWSIVLSVKPGLTDNASIEFINEEELLFNSVDPELTYRDYILPRKLNLYIDYVENHSIKKDILIILRTIQTIFSK